MICSRLWRGDKKILCGCKKIYMHWPKVTRVMRNARKWGLRWPCTNTFCNLGAFGQYRTISKFGQIYLALAKGDGNEGWDGRVKEMMKGDREHVKRKKKVKEASKESINQTIGAGVGERLFWFRRSANFGCSLIINRRQRNRNPQKKIGIEKDGDESNHRRASENMRARQLPEVSITHISDHPSFTLSFNAV